MHILRVCIKCNLMDREYLVSENNLPSLIYQHDNCSYFRAKSTDGTTVLTISDNHVVSKALNKTLMNEIKLITEKNCTKTYEPLQLYKASIEVLCIEDFYIYAIDEFQANKEFSQWCIFDPIYIEKVA